MDTVNPITTCDCCSSTITGGDDETMKQTWCQVIMGEYKCHKFLIQWQDQGCMMKKKKLHGSLWKKKVASRPYLLANT